MDSIYETAVRSLTSLKTDVLRGPPAAGGDAVAPAHDRAALHAALERVKKDVGNGNVDSIISCIRVWRVGLLRRP